MDGLTHVDEQGNARMVDVSGKPETKRRAVAEAFVRMSASTLDAIATGGVPKGDVLATARIAGIMAAKKTPDLVPLCHPLALTHVAVDVEACAEGVAITAVCETLGRTGVEMEALTAASVAALTVYDMCKALERGITYAVRLAEKSGGASGEWRHEEPLR